MMAGNRISRQWQIKLSNHLVGVLPQSTTRAASVGGENHG
jgi:hypothetical protein